jgi:hypothetical protein
MRVPLPPVKDPAVFADYVSAYQNLGIMVNELNRCMGIFDLVPEVIGAPVVDKLNYIHGLVLKTDAQHRLNPQAVTA